MFKAFNQQLSKIVSYNGLPSKRVTIIPLRVHGHHEDGLVSLLYMHHLTSLSEQLGLSKVAFYVWQIEIITSISIHGPLTRYVKLRVAYAPGMPGTFSPPPTSKETTCELSRHASRHVRHARAVMHIGIANPRWRGKRSRHCRCMRNTQFYGSGKRPMRRKITSMSRQQLWFSQTACRWDMDE